MNVRCECCVLSGRGLCDELIIRPEEACRLWCVVVYDLETSCMRMPCPTRGLLPPPPQNKIGGTKLELGIRSSSADKALRIVN